jgi:hypothetical protein
MCFGLQKYMDSFSFPLCLQIVARKLCKYLSPNGCAISFAVMNFRLSKSISQEHKFMWCSHCKGCFYGDCLRSTTLLQIQNSTTTKRIGDDKGCFRILSSSLCDSQINQSFSKVPLLLRIAQGTYFKKTLPLTYIF